jgi:hypothetical protein
MTGAGGKLYESSYSLFALLKSSIFFSMMWETNILVAGTFSHNVGNVLLVVGKEAVQNTPFRHCKLRGTKQEAILTSLIINRIASGCTLIMTIAVTPSVIANAVKQSSVRAWIASLRSQ